MAQAIAPVRVSRDLHVTLTALKRKLSYKLNRDLSLGEVIDALIEGYKPDNVDGIKEIVTEAVTSISDKD